ncbi:hypothetical protein HanXRQr2_Chr17g0827661 [Helianthus annuus]|uniref:Uncharacterized protein n=1 Tax=Helianthus annuus TaxID=4232 RepID=A0A9K3DLI8_HELAN|nr:hypothetical protein HanXRQr2_Chr17g0827661 [Helianthus annuus]
MENENKKRPEVNGDGRSSSKKIRAKKERYNVGVTAKDAELEEFLAIINRLQEGFDHFQKKEAGDCVGKSVPAPAMDSGMVDMGFEVEDFVQFQEGGRKNSAGDVLRNEVVFRFDLNADPASSSMSD